MNLRSNGTTMAQDNSDNNNFSNLNQFEDNLALPSTSTGYRGQSSSLFRIAEVDSDDDQSASSRPISPRTHSGEQGVPSDLVSIVPTPVNGSRDSLGESLRLDAPVPASVNTPPETRLRMTLRRARRNGRPSVRRTDSSESPPPKEHESATTSGTHSATVARLMNETNESELESSCSTEGGAWRPPAALGTPDSGVGTFAGSSTRNSLPMDDVSDDPEYQALKFRQRVKKARRNYRKHMDSDSN
ncbi:unnamed protein product, partial [Iphiclides podalirius]